ncbi:MAG TPA: outer-membrane lipoprotein carrier protein LolA [Terriglobales bacterium]|nr:outer-membrane lipoprotein carrier protein LolA [Terriglobales bacterium]
MKRAFLLIGFVIVVLCCTFAVAQNGNLEKVLTQMDAAAANFKSAQADFVWDQYTKVVEEHDYQKGTIYFRRESKGVQMAADINQHNGQPDNKYVLFSGSSVQVYQPTMGQVTKYNVGKNKSEVESFLVLGFGGRGHDLLKSFDVKYAGSERVDGIDTQKLELTPKSASVRNNFNRIVLWIDPARGVSVQQQLFSPSGDYRLAKYSNIKLNQNISADVFKLKTAPNTKVISPQG